MATFVVARPDGLRPAGDEALRDLMWAHVHQRDRIEHIRVRAGPTNIRVALFLIATDQHAADAVAGEVCRRIRSLPAFQN